jgi:hypothetical protein
MIGVRPKGMPVRPALSVSGLERWPDSRTACRDPDK